jgi:hypothetical protein
VMRSLRKRAASRRHSNTPSRPTTGRNKCRSSYWRSSFLFWLVLLRHITREGGKLLMAAEGEDLAHLEVRAGALARTAWEALRPPPDQQTIRVRAVAEKGGET